MMPRREVLVEENFEKRDTYRRKLIEACNFQKKESGSSLPEEIF
jgi:hypothetical protein